MEANLAGKVALVTGSSRGIGAAIARTFAGQGANVVINYVHSKTLGEGLARELEEQYGVETLAIKADVTREDQVAQMVERITEQFDAVDIVVNNALHSYSFDPDGRKLAWELEWDDYQRQLDGSLKGTYHVCKYAMPMMKSKGWGRIINIISDLVYRPTVPYLDYNTAKGAVLTFSQNLAAELGQFGITVNCLAPGVVYPTDASQATKEEVKNMIIRETPLHRIARPEDVAGSALFFASSWSDFVTGQCLIVDGGLNMK